MTFPSHNAQLFRRRRQSSPDKAHVKHGDVNHWKKIVERATEFALSEVFSKKKKPRPGISSQIVSSQTSDELGDREDVYNEAEALLRDWLRLKMEKHDDDDDDDDEDHMSPAKKTSSAPLPRARPSALKYSNFETLYNKLVGEEEQSAIANVLQNLMKQEVLGPESMMDLVHNARQMKKFIDPILTMEVRHQQVRENRARLEAERLREQKEREALQSVREEVRRREREEEMKRKQEERREEAKVQEEMVKLRRQMEKRRALEQLTRQRGRERPEAQTVTTNHQSAPVLPTEQHNAERQCQEQKIQSMIHMKNLKCLQRHFSGWYFVLLNQRLRVDKAKALCEWRVCLRAWRAWRAVVWAKRNEREVARAEEELRTENRQCQLAVESDRRRLLRRCLNEWYLCGRREKEQRELVAQQEDTRHKMAALIGAAAAGKLGVTEPRHKIVQPEAASRSEATPKQGHQRSGTLTHRAPPVQPRRIPLFTVAEPSTPQQVARHHVAPAAAEPQEKRHGPEAASTVCAGSAVSKGTRPPEFTGGPDGECASARKAEVQRARPHPIVTAMEARARRRAERRKEMEALRREKEEQKQAEMKDAEEEKLREEAEEKRRAAEKRKEAQRREREREEQKLKERKRQEELLKVARQHYDATSLLRRGLAPWKRLIQLRQDSMKLAEHHHNLLLLRRCILYWQQSAGESLSEKDARADRLYRHFLLRRSLSYWKRLMDTRLMMEERADRFYRTRTLGKFLQALQDHMTQEMLVEWRRQEVAQKHNDRRVLRRCVVAWRQLPDILRTERRRDERRERLTRVVAKVVPDFGFRPPEIWTDDK